MVVFDATDGGRGVEIETMKPGYICVVFINTHHPHGSVFPDNFSGSFQNTLTDEGIRIVCYSTKDTVSLAKRFEKPGAAAFILSRWKEACRGLPFAGHFKAYKRVKRAVCFYIRSREQRKRAAARPKATNRTVIVIDD